MKTYWIVLRKVQHAKKVLFNSLGLMNFAVMLLSTVFNSPNKQVKVFGGN